jgi:hypothetical protein
LKILLRHLKIFLDPKELLSVRGTENRRRDKAIGVKFIESEKPYSPEDKILDLNASRGNTYTTKNNIGKERKKKLTQNTLTPHTFRRRYIKARNAGLDPAFLISRTSYNSPSLAQTIKGQMNKNFSSTRHGEDRLGIQFHKMVDSLIESRPELFEIEISKRIKRHDVITRRVQISESDLFPEGAEKISPAIVVYSKTKSKRKIDYFTIHLNIENLERSMRKVDAIKKFKEYNFSASRHGDQIFAEIRNESDDTMGYRVFFSSDK